MTRYFRHYVDEDEAIDEHGTLRDGYGVRTSLMLRDSRGNMPGHRPGWIMSDADDDERQRAYDSYQRDVTNAWRGTTDGRKVTQRDPFGRVMSTYEEEDDLRDGMTRDELQRDHQRRTSSAYQDYDNWIQQQWRNP